MPRPAVLAVALGLSAGCGSEPRPTWLRLVEGADAPSALADAHGLPEPPGVPGQGFLREDLAGWVVETLPASAWERVRGGGAEAPSALEVWRAPLAIAGVGRPADGSPRFRLAAPGHDLQPLPWASLGSVETLAEPSFTVVGGTLLAGFRRGEPPPEEARAELFVRRSSTRRFSSRHVAAEGLVVWPGERCERRMAVPPGSTLRFGVAAQGLGLEHSRPLVFRISLEGTLLAEVTLDLREQPRALLQSRHAVVLPDGLAGQGTFRFEVEGQPASTAFLCPVVGPSEIGTYGARPWTEERPDVVLFLADTFRADNLAAYGGVHGLTPRIDRLADESLVFLETRSVSGYTLPAVAALFTGLYPHQAGIGDVSHSLPEGLATLAELFAAAGYRTGAVTEGGFVSQRYGLDRGFEWFDEQRTGFASTLERVADFLEADDGRPILLVVQTYRVHEPYHVSDETRQALGARLGIEGEFGEWNDRYLSELAGAPAEHDHAALREIGARLEALYRGGVADLDRELAPWLEDLERRGILGRGVFVLASDHGEAFYEHEAMFHVTSLWEEVTRVPLLIHAPWIEPGTVADPVSLVDLAPTLLELAGLPRPADWPSGSLFSSPRSPSFLFQCFASRPGSTAALVVEGRKVVVSEAAGEGVAPPLAAFHLGRDPGELHDVTELGEAWPAELLERWRAPFEDALRTRAGYGTAVLEEEDLADLAELGYAGG